MRHYPRLPGLATGPVRILRSIKSIRAARAPYRGSKPRETTTASRALACSAGRAEPSGPVREQAMAIKRGGLDRLLEVLR